MQTAASATDGAQYRVAGFWRRTVAAVLDGMLLLPLVMLFGGATSAVAGHALPRLGELGFGYLVHLAVDGGLAGAVALSIGALVMVLYLLIFTAMSGQTPGLRLLRLRVIDAYGEPPSLLRAALRIVGLALSILLFCLGYLWVAFSREKRGLHDLIAGTYVVCVEAPAASPAGANTQMKAQAS